jgi:hypothetical protein
MNILDPHEANCLQTAPYVWSLIIVLCAVALLLVTFALTQALQDEVIRALPGVEGQK